MNNRKLKSNKKAISPIIATLLLIAIAVVASLVVYAWVMGYIGYQTNNAGNSIAIQSVNFSGGKITDIYVQNMGTTTVTLDGNVYINGAQYTASAGSGALSSGKTADLTVSVAALSGQMYTVKVTTTSGTYSQITQQAP